MTNSTRSLKLRACSQNNLKNFDLELPKDSIIAFIGLSGSGKSSLAFDSVFLEGQRRFLECLNPKFAQDKKYLSKPKIEIDEGISPTLAVGHESQYLDFSSKLVVQADLYEHLSILYSKLAKQHSPYTQKVLVRQSKEEIVQSILRDYSLGAKLELFAPLESNYETRKDLIDRLEKQGFLRFYLDGEEISLDQEIKEEGKLELLVDRIKIKEGLHLRLSDSVKTALELSQGRLRVFSDSNSRYFTEVYVCPESGISFPPLEGIDFNPRTARGSCSACKGSGMGIDLKVQECDVESLFHCFPKRKKDYYLKIWNCFQQQHPFTQDKIIFYLLNGSEESVQIENESAKMELRWRGLIAILEGEGHVFQERFSDFICRKPCSVCQGSGLKEQSRFARIEGLGIAEFCSLSVREALKKIKSWVFKGNEALVAQALLDRIEKTLLLMDKVGLSYLELDREMKSLSYGEAQRVFLVSKIASKLSGVIYVLDEPSNGLHPAEVEALAYVIESLRDLGNTVFLVEHKKALIKHADYIVELGPGSGDEGGFVCFEGTFEQLMQADTISARCFQKFDRVQKKKKSNFKKSKLLKISSLSFHNIKNLDLEIPLNQLVGFCGVSGSGKSSLLIDFLSSELKSYFRKKTTPKFLDGYESIDRLLLVEQKAAGISIRSNPATYTDLMQEIRKLFAATKLAKARGYTQAHFSLNKKGGRCDLCEGLGKIPTKIGFASDLLLPCELCQARRFDFETLQVQWKGFSIADVLEMSAKRALDLFKDQVNIRKTLQLFSDLGLGYLRLGQNFDALSKGELQRIKLIAELAKERLETTLYVLDEPSMGLHLDEQAKLIQLMQALVVKGHSVFFVEHNLDILRQADYLIELGPKAGAEGGQVVFQGLPSKIAKAKTMTAKYWS